MTDNPPAPGAPVFPAADAPATSVAKAPEDSAAAAMPTPPPAAPYVPVGDVSAAPYVPVGHALPAQADAAASALSDPQAAPPSKAAHLASRFALGVLAVNFASNLAVRAVEALAVGDPSMAIIALLVFVLIKLIVLGLIITGLVFAHRGLAETKNDAKSGRKTAIGAMVALYIFAALWVGSIIYSFMPAA